MFSDLKQAHYNQLSQVLYFYTRQNPRVKDLELGVESMMKFSFSETPALEAEHSMEDRGVRNMLNSFFVLYLQVQNHSLLETPII